MINVSFTPEKWEAIKNTLELTEGADYELKDPATHKLNSEVITIRMSREAYDSVLDILPDHEVKSVRVTSDMFKDDEVYKSYKKAADKAYKSLEEYTFKKRNNIA